MVIESLKNRDMDEAEELTRVIAAARHAAWRTRTSRRSSTSSMSVVPAFAAMGTITLLAGLTRQLRSVPHERRVSHRFRAYPGTAVASNYPNTSQENRFNTASSPQ